jgi:1,4-alpha-glucan branching enzyme
VDLHDSDSSTISFLRRASDPADFALVCCNFTPIPRLGYRLGVPLPGYYREILNSDSSAFGGSNMGNMGGVVARETPSHGKPCSVILTLPPLAVVVLRGPQGGGSKTAESFR